MNGKCVAIAAAAISVLAGMPAVSAHAHGRGPAYARVVAVDPIVDYVVVDRPVRECRQGTVYRSADPARVAAATVTGGVLGGAIGNAVGRNLGDGDGQGALLALGAVAGSVIAHERARRNVGDAVAVPVERCSVAYERITEERVTGYWVTYRYRGRLHRTHTHDHPGDRILLTPVRRSYRYYD